MASGLIFASYLILAGHD